MIYRGHTKAVTDATKDYVVKVNSYTKKNINSHDSYIVKQIRLHHSRSYFKLDKCICIKEILSTQSTIYPELNYHYSGEGSYFFGRNLFETNMSSLTSKLKELIK